MSPIFLAFLLMLAAFLLLSLAAAARTIWLRFRPTGTAQRAAEQSPRNSNAADALLLLGIAMAWYSVATGWAVLSSLSSRSIWACPNARTRLKAHPERSLS